MFGNNPIRLAEKGTDLKIQEIFKTFQGEGPYVGWPAIFIRLGGCNLACNFCDTEFEDFSSFEVDGVLASVNEMSGFNTGHFTHKLAVITGGEPFRQNITNLCSRLIKLGYKVQIETNGTLYREIDKSVDIICSPKNTGHGYNRIREDLLSRLTAFKFLISASNDLYSFVAEIGQSDYKIPVYLQPMDEYDEDKNKANIELVKKLAEKYGYRISLQIHKVISVR